MSVNKVILIGRLGKDPEVHQTTTGHLVCKLSLATSESWKDQDGQKQERTEWHRVSAWGRLAEICGQYLAKGRQAYIEGKLQTNEYTDKDGILRYSTEIVAQSVQFLGSNNTQQEQQPQQSYDPNYDQDVQQEILKWNLNLLL